MHKLRVWWIPQVPMTTFYVEVDSVSEGVKIMDVLADYDRFQFENKVKPDYCNAGGLQQWNEEEQEYEDWYIDFDIEIRPGETYEAYFESPEEFLEFLAENSLDEEEVYAAMRNQMKQNN